MKTSKPKPYTVSDSIQKLFVAIALAAYALGIAIPIYYATRQYGSNSNLSSFTLWFIDTGALPLAFILIAYALNPKRKAMRKLNLAFETLVLASVGAAIVTFFSQSFNFAQGLFVNETSGYWGYIMYVIIGQVLAVVVYTLILLRLRKTKRW